MRNFWIEVDISTRKTGVATGPRGDGSADVSVFVKDDGKSVKAAMVRCFTLPDFLIIDISSITGDCIRYSVPR